MDTSMDISPVRRPNRKRSRTNEEDSTQPTESSRPTKRPAMGLELPLLQPPAMQQVVLADPRMGEIPTNTWRFSDDWVNKTGGLRLDSPIPLSMGTEDGDISRTHYPDRVQPAHGPVHGHLQPSLQEPAYLPTPKDSPVTSTADIGSYEFAVKGSRLRQSHTPAESSHIEPASRFDPTQLEDAIMQSPEMRPISPEKKRIVMGYREGCESCRLRVPGHYIHYI
ncbi:hypothetical protein M408DRAFT_329230 [Serendipita vermifera MAFF 305830]|uniref:Uncharacterized protein n=1 Tax=Serendipita vermifera MAFF 305830 TaxID=933852 RepID=A0A0C3BBD2_SERVB|nr:hypothetical protein M408DRAFT_329230 [Serendipita vermifera MAFF 305830]